MERAMIWSGEGEDQDGDWHVEFARVELAPDGLRATGVQLGAVPLPYRLDYALDATGPGFVTRSLRVKAAGEGWERRLRLERADDGAWTITAEAAGEVDLPGPGRSSDIFGEALDCDLGLSPLTNAMPVHRHGLHRETGQADFSMAWVAVPALSVRLSRQRYTHLRCGPDGASVRFEEVDGDAVVFSSDLKYGADGLIEVYPRLARRVLS